MVVLIQVRDRHDKWPSVFASIRRLWAGRSVEERLVRSELLSGNLCRTDRFRPSAARTAAATFYLCTVRFRSCASKRRPVNSSNLRPSVTTRLGFIKPTHLTASLLTLRMHRLPAPGFPTIFEMYQVRSAVQYSTVIDDGSRFTPRGYFATINTLYSSGELCTSCSRYGHAFPTILPSRSRHHVWLPRSISPTWLFSFHVPP